MMRNFRDRLLAAFQRRPYRGLDDELRFHIQQSADAYLKAGLSRAEANRRARIDMGSMEAAHEGSYRQHPAWLAGVIVQDLRYATRMLRKSSGFTTVAIASLALGIGANTAIFTVAKKILFDTLQVKNPHELRLLAWTSGHEQPVPAVWGDVASTDTGGVTSTAFSYPAFEALRERTEAFQDLIAFKVLPQVTATVDGHAETIAADMVSGNAFSMLGISTIAGRALTPGDDAAPGKGSVAVISESYWEQRFARSSSAIGKTIAFNGVPITIVGVAPGRFNGMRIGTMAQIFVPINMQPLLIPREQAGSPGSTSLLNNPESWWVLIMARMRSDVPDPSAQAALDLALRQAAMATLPHSAALDQLHLKLEPGARGLDYLRNFAAPSYVLLALAGLVLMLACVNLANLLLARAASRQREMCTRLALGAARGRILGQVLTESLLLSSLGGAAGLGLGYLMRNAIPAMLQDPWRPNTFQLDFDWRVLAFTVGISMATGILFGIIPAWQATRIDANAAIKDASHATASRKRLWLSKGLVIAQIALSTILLIGAGLFVRTLVNLAHTPLGFRPDHILLFQLDPPRNRYNLAKRTTLYRQLEEKLAAIPGVRSATMSNIAIIGDGQSGSVFHVSGRPARKDEDRVQTNAVGADFFPTLGIPILEGRGFNARDTSTSPKVAVVNRTLARQFFPNENPIGRTFETDPDDVAGPVEIVGIAADTRYADLRSETPPTYYMPYPQMLTSSRMIVEIQTAADPMSILSQVRATVESLDRDLPLIDVRTQTEQIASTMTAERMFAQLTGGFGVLALVLASIGIYGIMAYTVARRTSEIGIRMALGARAGQMLAMVLREASWMAVVGITVGALVAIGLARLIRTMLYGLSASDPLTLIAAAGLLFVIALLAGFLPARRASRVDPVHALRHE